MEATVNGFRMNYRVSGRAGVPPLLLIHGFPLDSAMWDAQLEGLADRAYVIAPDLRGHGQSDRPAGAYSMDQHADDLAALLEQLGVRKAVVAGLSMGGYVAFAFWRRHAERVAGLALVDTRANADTEEGRSNREATIGRVRERGVAALTEDMMPKLLSPENLNDAQVAGRVREMILRQPAEGMMTALAAMRDREDSTPTLATITVPTYVIGGEHDLIAPAEVTVTMAKQIRDARSVLIMNAGHMAPVENPQEVNMALSELLSIAKF